MAYKKITNIAIIFSIVATLVSSFVFGTQDITTNDKILDTTMQVLIFIQKYSWPVVTLIFIYALYKFYVAGSEIIEQKAMGQKLIVSIAIFMAIVQALPLIYAFATIR